MSSIIFGFAVFCGWLVFDTVKRRKMSVELFVSSAINGVIAGVFWWILDWVF